MQKFIFDSYGHLIPNKLIETNLEEIGVHFVEDFEESETRKNLFTSLKHYLTDFLIKVNNADFEVFINGSFVSKKENPNDIDIVVFLDYTIYKQIDLTEFKCSLSQRKLVKYEGIHAFIIEKYPFNHLNFLNFQADYAYWLSLFSKNRKGNKKGVLHLILPNINH